MVCERPKSLASRGADDFEQKIILGQSSARRSNAQHDGGQIGKEKIAANRNPTSDLSWDHARLREACPFAPPTYIGTVATT